MKAIWSRRAAADLKDALAFLKAQDRRVATRAKAEILAASAFVARRPLIARASPWPNLRLWSIPRWNKILVFGVTEAGIAVTALLDTRKPFPPTPP